jgi:hypothetical protein
MIEVESIDKSLFMFSKQRGNVWAGIDPTMPAKIRIFPMENWKGYQDFRAIITSVAISSQGNYQFLSSLGGNIYVYVFGDRMGEAVISGLAFDYPCPDKGSAETTGIEHVMQYYVANRIANRRTPLTITIGAKRAIRGYLVGFYAKSADPKDGGIYEFTLTFMLPPSTERLCRTSSSAPVVATAPPPATSGGGTAPLPDEVYDDQYVVNDGHGGTTTIDPSVGNLSGMPSSARPVAFDDVISDSGDWLGDYAEVPATVAGLPTPIYVGS